MQFDYFLLLIWRVGLISHRSAGGSRKSSLLSSCGCCKSFMIRFTFPRDMYRVINHKTDPFLCSGIMLPCEVMMFKQCFHPSKNRLCLDSSQLQLMALHWKPVAPPHWNHSGQRIYGVHPHLVPFKGVKNLWMCDVSYSGRLMFALFVPLSSMWPLFP